MGELLGFNAKPKTKTLFLKTGGIFTAVLEKRGKKFDLLDIAIGDYRGIAQDLRRQGFKVKVI